MTPSVRTWIASLFLIAVGCLQATGDVLNLRAVKAVGAATGASPAPKVFTAHLGFETYSSQFFIRWVDAASGEAQELHLTPALYRGVRGPYNRRNAYGAILSYAPVLHADPITRAMHDGAMRYALCQSGLLAELGIDPAAIAGPIVVDLVPRQTLPPDHGWVLHYEIDCHA